MFQLFSCVNTGCSLGFTAISLHLSPYTLVEHMLAILEIRACNQLGFLMAEQSLRHRICPGFFLHLLWLSCTTKVTFWLLIKGFKSREIFRVLGRWGKSSGHPGTDLFCRPSDQKARAWCLSPHAHSAFHRGHTTEKKKRLQQSWNILDKGRHKRIVLHSLWSDAFFHYWRHCYEEDCR